MDEKVGEEAHVGEIEIQEKETGREAWEELDGAPRRWRLRVRIMEVNGNWRMVVVALETKTIHDPMTSGYSNTVAELRMMAAERRYLLTRWSCVG